MTYVGTPAYSKYKYSITNIYIDIKMKSKYRYESRKLHKPAPAKTQAAIIKAINRLTRKSYQQFELLVYGGLPTPRYGR